MWANITEFMIKGSHPCWAKIPIIHEAFARYPAAKWVWWLDFDALIMSPTIDLGTHLLNPTPMFNKLLKGQPYALRGEHNTAQFIAPAEPDPNSINLVVSGDHHGLNAGSFFLRRGEWTDMLLDLWRDPFYVERDWPGREQDGLIHVIQHHKFISNHVGIVPQRAINAYWEGPENMIWHENDLVVHIAGCSYILRFGVG